RPAVGDRPAASSRIAGGRCRRPDRAGVQPAGRQSRDTRPRRRAGRARLCAGPPRTRAPGDTVVTIIVFTGPTLPPAEAAKILDATYRPPAAIGDVYRAAQQRPWAIGIIDGFFESIPSVWHKEVLWALAQGIHVYGAASMGALRAAELAAFGMTGVGMIFEAYRDGIIEEHDEVAGLPA